MEDVVSETPEAPIDDDESADAMFEVLWKRCLATWEDDKPHAALLQHALTNDQLPSLAGRYRALEGDVEKAPRAAKRIDAIVVAATQMLMSMKTPARIKVPWQWTASVGLACAVIIGWLAWKILGRHH